MGLYWATLAAGPAVMVANGLYGMFSELVHTGLDLALRHLTKGYHICNLWYINTIHVFVFPIIKQYSWKVNQYRNSDCLFLKISFFHINDFKDDILHFTRSAVMKNNCIMRFQNSYVND